MSLLTSVIELSPGKDFLKRFRENEFDLAGLADLPLLGQAEFDKLLHRIHDYAFYDRFVDDEKLAEVLYALLRLAQDEYEEGNFWGRLGDRLGRAVDGRVQGCLGDLFQRALKRFGYPVPRCHRGHAWLTPILMHAGVPRTSIPLFVRFVHQYADVCEDLDALELERLAGAEGVQLHRNVKRLLASRTEGAVQLWKAIARVVVAWPSPERVAEELGRLPLSVDPDAIRTALESLDYRPDVVKRDPVPRLRYDATTGDVRLWVPGEGSRWSVGDDELKLTSWEPDGAGCSAEVIRPLPDEFTVTGPDRKRLTFRCQPDDWPGLWFRASNGFLKPGDDVECDGLEPGRWLTVFHGTPDGEVAAGRQLNWKFLKGGQEWTAWEVDVPPRTPGRERLVWRAGARTFSVPLARRPSPRLELQSPALAVARCEGLDVLVFDAPPTVVTSRERGVAVHLVRRSDGRWVGLKSFELPRDRPVRLPLEAPGVYQVRESRNVGRVLLDFAVLPRFRQVADGIDARFERAVWVVAADASLGEFRPEGETQGDYPRVQLLSPNEWRVESSTIEPFQSLVWKWKDSQSPPLHLARPVEGLRWRIKGLSPETSRWTRSPIVLDPRQVLANAEAVRIEVHAPRTETLLINGVPAEKTVDGPTGQTLIRELAAYVPVEHVELGFQAREYPAVFLAHRPLVERFSAEADEETVVVTWRPGQPPGTVLQAWDPLSPNDAPITIPLTPEQLKEPGEWIGRWSELTGSPYVSLTMARRVAIKLGSRGSYKTAVAASGVDRAVAAIIARPGTRGGVSPWARFAHDLVAQFRSGGTEDHKRVARGLTQLDQGGQIELRAILGFHAELLKMEVQAHQEGARILASKAIRDFLAADHTWRRLLKPRLQAGQGNNRLAVELLGMGIHAGWAAENSNEFREFFPAYPLGYFSDIRRVSTPGRASPSRTEAARRLASFHEHWDLPAPSLALAWRWGRPHFRKDGPGGCLTFEAIAGANEAPNAHRLPVELGVADCIVDLTDVWSRERRVAAKPSTYSARQYRLEWHAGHGSSWTYRRYYPERSRRVGAVVHSTCSPLYFADCDPLALAKRLKVRRRLVRWGLAVEIQESDRDAFQGVTGCDDQLRSHPRCGVLLAQYLDPPKLVDVAVPDMRIIPGPSLIAWRLAWLDRLSAAERGRTPHGVDMRAGMDELAFLRMLGTAVSRWPDLMTRCLALAEFLRWTLCEGGVGIAFKFAGT